MIVNRIAAYVVRAAYARQDDPLEFQRRYQLGLRIQSRLFAPKQTARILTLKRKTR